MRFCLKRKHLETLLIFLMFPVVCMIAGTCAASTGSDMQGPDKCAECHTNQVEAWEGSAHAEALDRVEADLQVACASMEMGVDCTCLVCHTTGFEPQGRTYEHSGVTCEVCHGTYSEGHPEYESMDLNVDSEMCQGCHVNTHKAWLGSAHGQSNVQCVSCHQVHSQDLRMEMGTLCVSCHREQQTDTFHMLHEVNDISCSNCHVSFDGSSDVGGGDASIQRIALSHSPNHQFNVENSDACISCHKQTGEPDIAVKQTVLFDRTERLAIELDKVRATNRTLQVLPFVTLGVGLGVGGILGAILVLTIGYLTNRRETE